MTSVSPSEGTTLEAEQYQRKDQSLAPAEESQLRLTSELSSQS